MAQKKNGEENGNKFANLINKYGNITELDDTMIHELIDKITIHECEYIDNVRTQKIDINFNFIGDYDINLAELIAERQKTKKEASKLKSEQKEKTYQENRKEQLKEYRRNLKMRAEEGDAEAIAEYDRLLNKEKKQREKAVKNGYYKSYHAKKKSEETAIREKAADGDPEAIEKVKEYDAKKERARAQARAYYQRQKLKKKSNTLYPTDTAA